MAGTNLMAIFGNRSIGLHQETTSTLRRPWTAIRESF